MFLAKNYIPKLFQQFLFIWPILCLAVNIPLYSQGLPKIDLPAQAAPPLPQTPARSITAAEIGPNTNLVLLLDQIRTLTNDGQLQEAQNSLFCFGKFEPKRAKRILLTAD